MGNKSALQNLRYPLTPTLSRKGRGKEEASGGGIEMGYKSGVTLLEILVSMIILGLVTGGIFSAFVMGRKATLRSETELAAAQMTQAALDRLRSSASALPAPGLYVDDFMVQPPAGASRLSSLNLPDNPPGKGFRSRFQTNAGRAPQPDLTNHGDGQLLIVEGDTDLDGDGLAGVDFDVPPNGADLRRAKVRLRFTTPTP